MSRMKCRTIWKVNTRKALTMKRRMMVITNQEVKDDVVTSMNHVIIIKDTKEEPPFGDNIKDAPPVFEEGIQATVDELKDDRPKTY